MKKLGLALVLVTALYANGNAVVFGSVQTGKQSDDKQIINDAISEANHCNSNSDCGVVQFDCSDHYYNQKETTVIDSVNKYNTNPHYSHKCSKASVPLQPAVCRDNKCVPQG